MIDDSVKLIIERITSLETLIRAELDKTNEQLDLMYDNQQKIKEDVIRFEGRIQYLEDGNKDRGGRLGQLEKEVAVHLAGAEANSGTKKHVTEWVRWVVIFIWGVAAFILAKLF